MSSGLGIAAAALLSAHSGAQAATGRYACKAGQHSVVVDFSRKTMSLDDQTAPMTQGAATWRSSPGGHTVIVAPPENGGSRIFDINIDGGSGYSGFVICKGL